LIVVASVTGTDGDPQGMSRQAAALRAAQVVVCAAMRRRHGWRG